MVAALKLMNRLARAFDLCAIEKVSLQGINGSRKATRGIRLCESGWSETDPINLLLFSSRSRSFSSISRYLASARDDLLCLFFPC